MTKDLTDTLKKTKAVVYVRTAFKLTSCNSNFEIQMTGDPAAEVTRMC